MLPRATTPSLPSTTRPIGIHQSVTSRPTRTEIMLLYYMIHIVTSAEGYYLSIQSCSSLLAEDFRLLPEIRLLQGDGQQTIHKQ
ncbi:hypothetical protein OUZ56_017537 [Daphnia magna]|uniref:Uncharacterized protein n=1 Tax=Daphnia magna TaxID=35525 RepID=A0ABR0AT07_9CRUS|nr:hypothetical protein OUZ56_017537 [Daphnia magna]